MLEVGQYVRIRSLKKVGQLTSIRGKRAKVQVGSANIECPLQDLEISSKPQETNKPSTSIELPSYSAAHKKALRSLDLHGFTTAQAIAALELHLNQAILAGLDRIDIVHGLGSGKVKEAVYSRLAAIPAVSRFEIDMFNPGVTHVFL